MLAVAGTGRRADDFLKLAEAAKAWRDAWRDIMTFQERLIAEFYGLYKPILGAGPDHVAIHEAVETPPEIVDRVGKLQRAYTELMQDMLDEINLVDARIIKPAMDARASIQPLKKTIKKRQERKVQLNQPRGGAATLTQVQIDFERAHGKHDANSRKDNRTERERLALARSESEVAITKQVSSTCHRQGQQDPIHGC